MKQILGMVMRPCAFSKEDNEAMWKKSEFYTDKDFYNQYRKYMVAMQHVAECAKIYIENNWQKITDWTGLDLVIESKQGITEYYNYEERPPSKRMSKTSKKDTFLRMCQEIEEKNKAKHNPITSVTEVVLDHSDGDFSITINGNEHWWIDSESVIIIADFIEKKLNGEENNESGSKE
jgi:hypothetical protein